MPLPKEMRAFPAAIEMSLLDYFAAQALPTVISFVEASRHNGREYRELNESYGEAVARQCYDLAEAMMERRNASTPR